MPLDVALTTQYDHLKFNERTSTVERATARVVRQPEDPRDHTLSFRRVMGRKIRVNVMSETSFWGLENQGGHTGFLDCVNLMATHPDLEVCVNSNEPCDVLHSHSWGPAYFLRGGRHLSGRRVFTAHVVPETAEGALPLMNLARPIVRAYMKMLYNYSDTVIAVAPWMARLIAALGVESPIETIPNPLRSDRFFESKDLRREGRQLLGISDQRPVILGVGQIQPRKGIPDFAEVARATPDAQFVWVGGRPFGMMSAGIMDLHRLSSNPPPNLKFAGMFDLTLMPRIYNAADVFLFPSFQENCPYAPMEAAACGLPVIFRDLVEYRALYNSTYLHAPSVEGMIACLHSLLSSDLERKRWSALSKALVSAFKPEAYVDKVASLYDRLALSHRDPVLALTSSTTSSGRQ